MLNKNQLLKLLILSCTAQLYGCVSGGGDNALANDSALCNGQQWETIESADENRTGSYITVIDVVTGECIAPEDQLQRGFAVTIEDYDNSVQLNAAASILDRADALLELPNGESALRWRESFQDLLVGESFTNNEGSIHSSDIELDIEFLITESGLFRATTIGTDDASHLAIFGTGLGQINYKTFSGATLRESEYEAQGPRARYNSNIQQSNILAELLAADYARLADGGAMTNPLKNHAELYSQSPTAIKNYFKRKVFIMRSFLYHNRMDYDALEVLDRTQESAWNKLWSPFGDDDRDPAQTLMSRSYTVDYTDGATNSSMTYLQTWSGSHMLDAWTSIRATGHYGSTANVFNTVNEPGSIFSVSCSPGQSGCELSTSRNAGVAVYIKDFSPASVEMEMNNSWALSHTAVITATFSDWNTLSRSESPSKNGNPNPLSAYIEPDSY